ncbi:hypothetical protein QCA50_014638 [Cerrena zonata]|uniref:Uncharacterized protein n=1 Tax=Cerrena zonata TaxID=2478898 RepID=A0AAW0FL85_9APHY
MGFFSGRRSEDNGQSLNLNEPQSVVRVIRSRFYGKHAGKNRAPSHAHAETASFPASASVSTSVSASPSTADTQPPRSHPLKSYPSQNGISSSSKLPSSSTRPERPTHVTATSSNGSHAHVPTSAHPHAASSIHPSPSRPSISSISTSPRARPVNANTMHASPSRTSTDAITLTLAQRLQELATANADGLLNDDEYRLLRQDLFDRLAGGSAIPQEAPVVPVHNPAIIDPGPSRHSHSRQTSFYDTQSTRASSTTSKRSLSSTVTGLLKRATSRRRASGPSEFSDTASVFSTTSTAQRSIYQQTVSHRTLTKQGSDVSLATDYAASPRLSRTESSLKRPTRERSHSMSRSIRSSRKGAMPPPSSFPSANAPATPYQTAPIDGSADDEYLRSTDDIRREIEAVEAEGKRLLDAFNGLELSTLVKKQRDPGMSNDGRLRAGSGSQYGGGSSRMDVDSQSIRSNLTNRTGHSSAAPPRPSESNGSNGLNGLSHLNRNRRNASTSNSAASLYRKNSISAMSTHSKSSMNPHIPPTPTTPSRLPSRLRLGSTSSVNLVRSSSHLPLAPVAERVDPPLPNSNLSNPPLTPHTPHLPPTPRTPHRTLRGFPSESDAMSEMGDEMHEEMNDIRRRKAEVTARYEARVEYLRARLKGAELREKLLKT